MGTLRLWIVKLDSGEVLALSARDPHPHGCNVAWRPDLETAGHTGWFRELCLGSTYSLNGVKALGPSPRGMDRYETRVYCDDAQIYLGPKTLIEGSGDLAPYFSGR